jgi:UDPglucose 6-dehydrogenase
MKKHKIGFIGLGKLGLEVAEFFSLNNDVSGYDIIKKHSSKIKIEDKIENLKDRDIIFIAVQTPHDKKYDGSNQSSHLDVKDFNYSYVIDVIEKLNLFVNNKQIVCLISTVIPGTIREKFLKISNFEIIYNPYLIAMNSIQHDMLYPETIILGYQKNSKKIKIIKELYINICKEIPFFVEGTYEEAESFKVFYNTWITNKINFVNMIQDVCYKIGNADPNKICKYLSMSNKRLISDKYMIPGLGDGGPCHPRDNIALSYLNQKIGLNYDFFKFTTLIREKQAENLADFITEIHNQNNLELIINGLSYKENSNILDGSYINLICSFLKKNKVSFKIIDPLLSPLKLDDKKYLVFLGHKKLYFKPNEQSIIIDIWKNFKNKKYKIIHYEKLFM